MRILSGALPASDSFLHVGYLSAYPRPFNLGSAWRSQDLILNGDAIDVAAALRLKDAPPPLEAAAPQVTSAGVIPAPNIFSQTLVVFLGAFVLGVLALYAAKRTLSSMSRAVLRYAALACAVAGLASLFVAAKQDNLGLLPPDTPPPWEGVATRAYADPDKATRVLMHGIVGDALANAGVSVQSLAQLKDEVGLPTAQPTEGERYALQTYGLDGWGHPFRLEGRNLRIVDKATKYYSPGRTVPGTSFSDSMEDLAPRYILTSAGPDGTFDTADDLYANIEAKTDLNWDEGARGLYLYGNGNESIVFIHRWRGKSFQYAHREQARQLTGGDLYDLAPLGKGNWFLDPSLPPDTPKGPLEAAERIYSRLALTAEQNSLILLIPKAEMIKP